ncbi:unnamed protein product [Ostreobium quekettii]|uniref:APAF-1 helical domain-containing protein n=1 Tax=Ostreobium quekettii TaxID=121088 RepID=A0A8S1IUG2_9CHLO|nr:unnamed protein product [Ostreobium quekettii]
MGTGTSRGANRNERQEMSTGLQGVTEVNPVNAGNLVKQIAEHKSEKLSSGRREGYRPSDDSALHGGWHQTPEPGSATMIGRNSGEFNRQSTSTRGSTSTQGSRPGGRQPGGAYGLSDDHRGGVVPIQESSFFMSSWHSPADGGGRASGSRAASSDAGRGPQPSGEGRSGRPSQEHIAARSSFFSSSKPSSTAGSQDYDAGPTTSQKRPSETKKRVSTEQPISHKDEGSYVDSSACQESMQRVRPSMDIAGGPVGAWAGSSGAPERISLQIGIRASTADPRKVSESSSELGPPRTSAELLPVGIPPPPPPRTAPPPDSLREAWADAEPSTPEPSAGMSTMSAPPLNGQSSNALMQHPASGPPARQMDASGYLPPDVLQSMGQMELAGGGAPSVGEPGGSGPRGHANVRSSFAAERKSVEYQHEFSSLDIFQNAVEDGSVSRLNSESFSGELRRRYHQLAVLPADVPVPISLLARLWGTPDLHDAEAAASLMESRKILKMAILEDDSAWCIISPFHLGRLQDMFRDSLKAQHSRLVNLYRQGFHNLALVPDDQYFMQNIANHLVEADRLEEMAGLLRDPIWLETKLRSYGTGAVVSDFRRYLMVKEDPDIKLLLRSFQMSAAASLDHPNLYILKEQMLSRLMVAAQRTNLGEWYETARAECWLAVPHRRARNMPVHMLPRRPTLEQAGGLQRLILRGHSEAVRKVVLAPNGMEVITGSADGAVRVWDMEIGDCVLLLEEHQGPITSVSISADGQTLASGSDDAVAIVWDLSSGIWRHKLRGHKKRINAVAIDPQGRRLVTSSQDMTTRIWSLSKGNCLHVLSVVGGGMGPTWEDWTAHHGVAISPDSRLLATVDAEYCIRVWKMETGEPMDTLEGHTDWVKALAFAGDSGSLLTASHDKTIRLWDLWTGVCNKVFTGHRGRINNLVVTPDGKRAVSVSDDNTAIVWDIENQRMQSELCGHGAWINDAAITHNGQRVVTASGDDLAVYWDATTGEALRVCKGHSGEVNSVELSYKGRFAITAAEDGTARVWDLQAPNVPLPEHHQGKVIGIVMAPDGVHAVTIGEDNVALVWDVKSGECLHILRGHSTGLHWAYLVREGELLVTGSGDRRICLWDVKSGICVNTMPDHRGSRMKSFAISPDGRRAVIVLFDSTVSVWNLDTMECTHQLMKRAERDGIRVHAGGVNAVYLMKAGTTALTISKDCTARVWDLETAQCTMMLTGHEDGLSTGVVKEDGTMCLTASYDKTARLWDLNTGECSMVLDHPKEVDHVAVDPQWHRAVTIAEGKTAWLWDIKKGRCLGVLEGHSDEIAGAVFSSDSRFVVTYSTNSVVRVWTAHSGRLRVVFMGDCGITSCAFGGSKLSDTIIAGDGNGLVHFLDFPAEELSSSRSK